MNVTAWSHPMTSRISPSTSTESGIHPPPMSHSFSTSKHSKCLPPKLAPFHRNSLIEAALASIKATHQFKDKIRKYTSPHPNCTLVPWHQFKLFWIEKYTEYEWDHNNIQDLGYHSDSTPKMMITALPPSLKASPPSKANALNKTWPCKCSFKKYPLSAKW